MSGVAVELIPWKDLEIGDALADGSFAVVYKAVYRGKPVAVKKWKSQEFSQREIDLFRREVESNSLFDHPNIVKFFGVCTDPVAIITELVVGRDLWEIVHDPSARLTWADVKKIATGCARGMAHIHEKGQIHRDLKSLNLLISQEMDCKICDFGLSRYTQRAARGAMTGGCGTVQWMAPEVIMHNDSYDAKVDVFSYGVVLWEMCARDVPYRDYEGNEMRIAAAVAQMGKRPPIPDGTPPAVADLMRRCWDNNPAQRPTAQEIVDFWAKPDAIPDHLLGQPILPAGAKDRAQAGAGSEDAGPEAAAGQDAEGQRASDAAPTEPAVEAPFAQPTVASKSLPAPQPTPAARSPVRSSASFVEEPLPPSAPIDALSAAAVPAPPPPAAPKSSRACVLL